MKFREAKKLNMGDFVMIKKSGRSEMVTSITITYDHKDDLRPMRATNLTALISCNDGNIYRHSELTFV